MGLVLPPERASRPGSPQSPLGTKSFPERHWNQFYNLNLLSHQHGAPVGFDTNVSHTGNRVFLCSSFFEGLEARVFLLVILFVAFFPFANFVPPHKPC